MAEAQQEAGPKIFRVMFNEITKNAIQKAFEKPLTVNVNLVEAQQARRVLDRLVGYKISPLLWDKVRRGLSAGRVQTVALRLIVEREREIRAFQKREYWTIDVDLNAKKPPVLERAPRQAQRRDRRDRERGSGRRGIVAAGRRRRTYTVASVADAREAPQSGRAVHHLDAAAGILAQAALQREAHHDAGAAAVRRHGDRQGRRGRSDHLHAYRFDARFERRDRRSARFHRASGSARTYVPDAPNIYKSKKDAQDAHEAIRPTSVHAHAGERRASFLAEDELKLYRLIWMRFVASQMTPAVFDQTTIDVDGEGQGRRGVSCSAPPDRVPKFDGFLDGLRRRQGSEGRRRRGAEAQAAGRDRRARC